MTKKSIASIVSDTVEQGEGDNTITLSTGVVLKGKQVPPLAIIRIMSAFPRPKPPVYMSKTMGREMENPDDPDYIERIKSWQIDSSNAILNALILLGTELVSKPKKMTGPDDDDWLDEYRMLSSEMLPQNRSWRYLTWVTFKAAVNEKDIELIKEVVGGLSGVPESEVKSAEQFPGSDTPSG